MSGITKEGFNAWREGRILTDAKWERRLGRLRFKYERRSKGNAMGRFGGGWNWNIGVQVGGATTIINLLVASLRIERMPLCASYGEAAHPTKYVRHDGGWKHFHPDCWVEQEAGA